eukprot:1654814-Prymnesium_polylepis.1
MAVVSLTAADVAMLMAPSMSFWTSRSIVLSAQKWLAISASASSTTIPTASPSRLWLSARNSLIDALSAAAKRESRKPTTMFEMFLTRVMGNVNDGELNVAFGTACRMVLSALSSDSCEIGPSCALNLSICSSSITYPRTVTAALMAAPVISVTLVTTVKTRLATGQ